MSYPQADLAVVEFNPIEDIETFLLRTNWVSERVSRHELLINIKGNYCEYHTTVHWNPSQDILHFALSFSVGLSREPLSPTKEIALLKLLSLLNEVMAMGHFDLWREENSVVWRYGQIFSEENATSEYFSHIFRIAVDTCERHYPVFQFVLWAGQSPYEALQSVMFDTVGEA